MAKNIILLSDGTGNSSGKLAKTNVWRLYQALDLSTAHKKNPLGQEAASLSRKKKKQIAYYDDGVGTASFKPLALLGGITGWGLKRNVLDLYTFLCRHYEEGDEIYCFGFSRGAFTIRVLAGLIGNQGLVQASSEGELQYLAKQAFRAYRACYERTLLKPVRTARNLLLRLIPGRKTYLPLKKTKLIDLRSADKRKTGKNVYDANLRNIPPASYLATPEAGYAASATASGKVEIKFLGLWDTVAAYGLPFDELTHAWDFIFPLSFPDRNLGSIIDRACHALALDDERHSFHPELWNENAEDYFTDAHYSEEKEYWQRPLGERLKQVWFAGMHSNLGGGYPDDGLAHVALNWMMDEVEAVNPKELAEQEAEQITGLRFITAERKRLRAATDIDGKMYDSRRGLSGAYRYLPRKLEDLLNDGKTDAEITQKLEQAPYRFLPERLKEYIYKKRRKNRLIIANPKIHESVFRRIHNNVDAYAPIGLPLKYQPSPAARPIGVSIYEETDEVKQHRVDYQEKVWNLVWWKRAVYFLTISIALLLLLLPSLDWKTPWESWFDFLAPVIGGLGAFVPGFADRWITTYQERPLTFLLIVALLLLCLKGGSILQRLIFDRMRAFFIAQPSAGRPKDFLYRVRTLWLYKWFFKSLKRWVIPSAILVVAVLFILRSSFVFLDSQGLFSVPTPGGLQSSLTYEQGKLFDTRAILNPSGMGVEAGKRYLIRLTVNGDSWHDASIPAGFNGFEKLKLLLAIPMRRNLGEPWFKPIARIGNRNNDDYVLEPLNGSTAKTLIAEITPKRSGELFLFVNDAVLPVGQRGQLFYNNNEGTAIVEVTEYKPGQENIAANNQ
jgi:uncharacterized protein (DUF2235 family)